MYVCSWTREGQVEDEAGVKLDLASEGSEGVI